MDGWMDARWGRSMQVKERYFLSHLSLESSEGKESQYEVRQITFVQSSENPGEELNPEIGWNLRAKSPFCDGKQISNAYFSVTALLTNCLCPCPCSSKLMMIFLSHQPCLCFSSYSRF